jgi:hypothetical protein
MNAVQDVRNLFLEHVVAAGRRDRHEPAGQNATPQEQAHGSST